MVYIHATVYIKQWPEDGLYPDHIRDCILIVIDDDELNLKGFSLILSF